MRRQRHVARRKPCSLHPYGWSRHKRAVLQAWRGQASLGEPVTRRAGVTSNRSSRQGAFGTHRCHQRRRSSPSRYVLPAPRLDHDFSPPPDAVGGGQDQNGTPLSRAAGTEIGRSCWRHRPRTSSRSRRTRCPRACCIRWPPVVGDGVYGTWWPVPAVTQRPIARGFRPCGRGSRQQHIWGEGVASPQRQPALP